jgi:antitoxin Phd
MKQAADETQRRRLLIVEDSGEAYHRYARALSRAGFEVSRVSASDVLTRLTEESFDASVLDISTRSINGLDVLREMRERSPDLPVILVLGAFDNRTVIRASELGAVQFLVKPKPPDLLEAAGVAVRLKRSQKWQSNKCSTLTQVFNRFSESSESFTATVAKNEFGRLLDVALQGRTVYITKHDAPKAVLLSVEQYNSLIDSPDFKLDTLSNEFDALLAQMQTPEARRRMTAAFSASPRQLGEAAVAAARKRG